jgi:hypothetical protein
MGTDEYPPRPPRDRERQTIGNSTGVSLGLLGGVLVAVFAAGGAYFKLQALESRVEANERTGAKDVEWKQQSELRQQRLEDHWQDVQTDLRDIKADLASLKSLKGHGP